MPQTHSQFSNVAQCELQTCSLPSRTHSEIGLHSPRRQDPCQRWHICWIQALPSLIESRVSSIRRNDVRRTIRIAAMTLPPAGPRSDRHTHQLWTFWDAVLSDDRTAPPSGHAWIPSNKAPAVTQTPCRVLVNAR